MGQIVPVVLKDNLDANVSFAPVQSLPLGITEYAHRPNGRVDLQSVMTINPARDRVRKTSRAKVKLTIPLVTVVEGVDMLLGENIIIDVDIRYPDAATDADRERALAYVHSLTDSAFNTTMRPVLKGTESLW